MKKVFESWLSLLTVLFVLAACCSTALAAPTLVSPSPNSFGEVERITLNNPADVYSGGVMVVGGVEMILPRNLLIDLPANRLSLQQIFDQAPAACKALGESGLAKSDRCNASGSGGIATLSAVRTNAGNVIVGDLFIQKAAESVVGVVTFINYAQGYYRVNGITGSDTTGAMVRLNDPTSRHTIQNGAGCAGGPNCSPDPRFTLDPDNYTNTFSTGYPVCIPSTIARPFPGLAGVPAGTAQAAADGTGDLLCPDTNRTAALLEPPVADSRRFAPVKIGDSVVAEGNYETIGGVRFLSAHSSTVQKALSTQNVAGQPDYLFLEEVFIEAPGFQNQRARAMWIGFTTLAPTDVDIWSIHRDPVTGAAHEFPLASVQGCDNAAGAGSCGNQGLINAGVNIFKIRYDVDFLMAALGEPGGAKARLNPCSHLLASRFAISNPGICPGGTTFANNMGIISPVPHEIIARTGRKIDSATNAAIGNLVTLDINGAPATNGEYLFPLGLNLGGIEVAEFSEIDLNALNTPVIFEGIPWNLDRRLSPSGCLKGGCEPIGTSPMGTFALDPFPFTGLDPRTQADFTVIGLGTGGLPTGSYNDPAFNNAANPLGNVRNRIFSFVDAALGKPNGNATVLPYVLGTFPADPPLIAINPTPALNLFAPVAVNDTTATGKSVPVTINVLANDIAIMGTIDPASVLIASSTPANGTPAVNFDGTIAYTPVATFTGTDSFTYTVANNLGGRSNAATVTVTVVAAPTAVPDTAASTTGTQITINVIANDSSVTSSINPSSVNVVSLPTCGTVTNPANGTLLFTAPATVLAAPGTCTFSYVVSDTFATPLLSNVATVTVTVTAPDIPPVAVNDTATTLVNSSITINAIANDTSATSTINPATLVVTAATGGTATANPNGTITYAAPAAPGTYSFAYTVQDSFVPPGTSNPAIVTVTVTGTNTPPVANNDTAGAVAGSAIIIPVLANDTSATSTINPATVTVTQPAAGGGTAAANLNGTVTYTPPATPGTYTFTYTVQDNFATPATSNAATVTVNVALANVAPVTAGDTAVTTTGTTITIPVLANDTSATNTLNPATVVVTATTGGTAVANLNGTVTYTAPAAAGTYTFAYTVQDNFVPPATSNAALVTVTVTAVDIPPTAGNDTASALTGATIIIPVLANDTSATSTINPATIVLTPPSGGTATANTNGTVSYTAPAVAGTHTFTYTVQDSFAPPATSNIATVTVTVTAPVIPPTAVNDGPVAMFGGAGANTVINVIANDTAGSSAINPASVVIVTQPINGSAVANAAGTVTYAPAPGFVGTDTFTYTVRDSLGAVSNSATVTINVAAPSTESLTVTLAQFIVNGSEWRVEGTTTARTPGETVSIFNGATVAGSPLVGTATVDPNGVWKFGLKPGQLPNTLRKISIQSSLTPPQTLEGITLVVR